ncbi:peptidase [Synergistales bacterium]|nr:peptidase [Synergistales bacterium]
MRSLLACLMFVCLVLGSLTGAFSPAFGGSDTLTQDESLLTGENGKIVAQKKMSLWTSKEVDIFKVTYKSDELLVTGYVTQPIKEGKYPLIVYCRGGNLERYMLTKNSFKGYLDVFGEDFIVVASQLRGNDGGKGTQDYAGKDVDDILNIYELGKSLPNFNGEVYMYGISEGGVGVYLGLTKGIPAKAAVVISGVADLAEWYKRETRIKGSDSPVLKLNKKQIQERNPLEAASKIRCPILIADAGDDKNVDPNLHGKKMEAALKASGVEVQREFFPNGGHVLGNMGRKNTDLVLAWFKKH